MPFNIIIDLDGVITNLDFIKSKKDKQTVLDADHEKIYQNPAVRRVLFTGIMLYARYAPVRAFAKEMISAFKNDGDTVKIVTKRLFGIEESLEGAKMRAETESHLLEHEIFYDEMRFVNSNKVSECEKEQADVIIEDNPDTIMALAKASFKVICFRTGYNEHIKSNLPNIFIARNWLEVARIVKQLKGQKIKTYSKSLVYKES